MEKLKKHQTIPFVDISDSDTPSYARIGKSTIFDLVLNANVITNNYIEDEMPTDEVDYYKPTLSQERATIKGDTAFDFFYEKMCIRDRDNIAFAKKFINDALVACGVLPNDGWRNIHTMFDMFDVDATRCV